MAQVSPIAVHSDNYVWVIATSAVSPRVAVIDPGEAEPVAAWLRARGLGLAAILLTHRHGDHVAGVPELIAGSEIPVYGPRRERIRGVNIPVGDGASVVVDGLELDVWEVPGHTAGHLAFVAPDLAFTGDTLFAAGCGRLFEGTAEEMHASLDRLAALPADTEVYCGHEYTVANLRFALVVEPENPALARRLDDAVARRERGEPTLPSTVGLELATNPFLRCRETGLRAAAERFAGRPLASAVEVFAAIRAWKDEWPG